MPPSARLLLALTALCCLASVMALPMEGIFIDHQCRCIGKTNSFMNARTFQKIEILPPGSHCRNTEIIITLKSKKEVCVDPETEWVKKLIAKIIARTSVKM